MKFLFEDEEFDQISIDDYMSAKNGEDLYNKIEDKSDIEDWFEVLVPDEGKAETVAGEIIRAMMRIMYRDYNDGDVFYSGYGVETCGSAAAYLMYKLPENIGKMIEEIAYDELRDDRYTAALEELSATILDYLNDHKELVGIKNEEDMYEYDLDDSYIPTYDIDFEIPANLQKHIDNGDIDLESEVRDWEVYGEYLGDAADSINVSYGTLYINGITEDLYNELSRYGYNWLVDFGNDLDKEFPDKEETIEDNEDDE